jgi:hypothetical protein
MLSYRVYNQVSYKIPDWISNSFSKCVKKNVALKTYEIQKSTVLGIQIFLLILSMKNYFSVLKIG